MAQGVAAGADGRADGRARAGADGRARAAPVVAANADAADADAASFATAAPLLREEALVVSLLDDPPPAYGHDSFEAFLEAFAAEYGVSLAALTRASDAYAASGKVGGSTLTTSPGKKHDGRVAEIRLRGDEELSLIHI